MENFNISIDRVINTYDGEYFHMINVKVTIIKGKFPRRALPEYVSVTDGVHRVSSFMARVSDNEKELNASFTTDAFSVFSAPVNIEFGYGGEIMGVFENFDIHHNIVPLAPILSGVNVPDADNAWLQNIINA